MIEIQTEPKFSELIIKDLSWENDIFISFQGKLAEEEMELKILLFLKISGYFPRLRVVR